MQDAPGNLLLGLITDAGPVDPLGEDEARSCRPHEQGAACADGCGIGHGDPVRLGAQGATADIHDDRHHGCCCRTSAEDTGCGGHHDHDDHHQQLGVGDAALQIIGQVDQNARLTDRCGKVEERCNGQSRLQLHMHGDLHTLDRADRDGGSVAQDRNDLGRDHLLRHEAPCGKHTGRHRHQQDEDVIPDPGMLVLTFQV